MLYVANLRGKQVRESARHNELGFRDQKLDDGGVPLGARSHQSSALELVARIYIDAERDVRVDGDCVSVVGIHSQLLLALRSKESIEFNSRFRASEI